MLGNREDIKYTIRECGYRQREHVENEGVLIVKSTWMTAQFWEQGVSNASE